MQLTHHTATTSLSGNCCLHVWISWLRKVYNCIHHHHQYRLGFSQLCWPHFSISKLCFMWISLWKWIHKKGAFVYDFDDHIYSYAVCTCDQAAEKFHWKVLVKLKFGNCQIKKCPISISPSSWFVVVIVIVILLLLPPRWKRLLPRR